jgi:hypothetical protein
MSLRAKQNAEVYEEMVSSGKSLLELYLELKQKYASMNKLSVIHGYDPHFYPALTSQNNK